MNIINPYDSGTNRIWLKGNLHAHTEASSCGHYPLAEVAGTYSDRIMKYDFLAITDHMQVTDVSPVQGVNGLVMFGGTEFKKEASQTLGINISSYQDEGFEEDETNHQKIFDEVVRQGGINIICHPHLYRENYWPLEKLLELHGYIAIEIYNHNVKMNSAGRAVASDLWDELLSRDRRIWGVASDDFHHRSRYGGGFIMVLAEKSPAAILEAIKKGAFYASSGIRLGEIKVIDGRTISVAAAAARVPGTVFRFIGKGGTVLKEEKAALAEGAVSYTVNGSEGYVRVEAGREDGAMAWTQPFWLC
jgi:histidinol phosphatase-like PHP family hydrolase